MCNTGQSPNGSEWRGRYTYTRTHTRCGWAPRLYKCPPQRASPATETYKMCQPPETMPRTEDRSTGSRPRHIASSSSPSRAGLADRICHADYTSPRCTLPPRPPFTGSTSTSLSLTGVVTRTTVQSAMMYATQDLAYLSLHPRRYPT